MLANLYFLPLGRQAASRQTGCLPIGRTDAQPQSAIKKNNTPTPFKFGNAKVIEKF